jgi:hypothetical protein
MSIYHKRDPLIEKLGGVYSWCIIKVGRFTGWGMAYWKTKASKVPLPTPAPQAPEVNRLRMDRGRHFKRATKTAKKPKR